jgi:hypothetical protein
VLESLTVTGAAKIPIEHSWKAPKISMSTAPVKVCERKLKEREGLEVYLRRGVPPK